MRFGQHRSGGDVGILAVAFDDAAVRQFEPGPEAVAVDGQKAGSGIEPRRGQRHSLERRIQDVDLVDPLGGDRFDGPCHGFAFDNHPKLLAVALGHLLRIVEQGIVEIGRQHHGRGKNRPGETPPPGLVASRFGKIVLKAIFKHSQKH